MTIEIAIAALRVVCAFIAGMTAALVVTLLMAGAARRWSHRADLPTEPADPEHDLWIDFYRAANRRAQPPHPDDLP